jgi:hypothetical protein
MSITDLGGKIKLPAGWFLLAVFLLSNAASFGLGRLAALEAQREPVRWEQAAAVPAAADPGHAPASPEPVVPISGGAYVASKSGKAYHLPWCSGAQRIKEANKIYFASKAEAEQAGYTPAANCPGI